MKITKKILAAIALVTIGLGLGLTIQNTRTITELEIVTITEHVEVPAIEYRDTVPVIEIQHELPNSCENQRRLYNTEDHTACIDSHELANINELCLDVYTATEWTLTFSLDQYYAYQPLVDTIDQAWANCENLRLAP